MSGPIFGTAPEEKAALERTLEGAIRGTVVWSRGEACPTCRDHGIYGDADETTGDVVDTYCACLHGQARRARDEQPSTVARVTKVVHNGWRRPDREEPTIEYLLDLLTTQTLRPSLAPFSERMSEDFCAHHGVPAGSTFYFGNFEALSHAFSVITNAPALVARFDAAIAANVATPAYASAKAAWIRTCLCKACEPEMRNPSVCRKDL